MGSPDHRVVDIHTHMYPPAYIRILESRSSIPLIRQYPGGGAPRLIILPAEAEALDSAASAFTPTDLPGRPVTSHYSSLEQKLHFMDIHHIDISVLSLANPWLDFVPSEEASEAAKAINQEFSNMCASSPGRLFFFATLPVSAPPETLLAAVGHVRSLKYCRGVILGTTGLGKGLDDPALVPVFRALAANKLPVFLHPHYGLPSEVYGARAAAQEYGHVLPLALGFPMETTIAVARMYLAGVFDQVPKLRMILAHSGGTLPFLAGRIESCIVHDGHLVREGKVGPARRTVWQVLRSQIYLDAVVYSEVGLKAAAEAAGGADRLMFGTDHPFFPPLGGDEQGTWESATRNARAVRGALGEGGEDARKVMGANAIEVLGLHEDG
ncbi:hypothetical protein AAE478_003921 [Parahypoxylon ruwenzoriense]